MEEDHHADHTGTAQMPRAISEYPDQRQMEGAHPARPDAGDKTVRRAQKIHRKRVAEGADRPAAGYGSERAGQPQGLCRGAAAGRIQPDRAGAAVSSRSWMRCGTGERLTSSGWPNNREKTAGGGTIPPPVCFTAAQLFSWSVRCGGSLDRPTARTHPRCRPRSRHRMGV